LIDKQKIIVIGNGMVGHKFLQNLVDTNQAANFDISVLCEEPRAAYDRVQLSAYFSANSSDDLSLVDDGFFELNNIAIKLNCQAVKIDREDKTVTTQAGECLAYDKLVLATGSTAFVPPIEGNNRPHCHVYRTIEDLEAIKASAQQGKVGVVIGGGLLGLEAAKALNDLGLQTHVVEFAPRLMAVQLDDAAGALLKDKIQKLGVTVHTNKNVEVIRDGAGCVHSLQFANGDTLETDVVVFGAGIRPQDTLARDSGLELGPNGGIKINTHCQSNDLSIYAIGECAALKGKIFGLVAPGYLMAKVAAQSISQSGYAQFKGSHTSTKLKLLGVDVASIGDCHARTEGAVVYSYFDGAKQTYKKIVLSPDQTRVIGAVMVGDASDYQTLLQMALNKTALPAQPESLILPAITADKLSASAALPDKTQICACYEVSKATIRRAVQDGANTIQDVKAATKASTGCGGCTDLVTDIITQELTSVKTPVKVARAVKVFDPANVSDDTKICFCAKVNKGQISQAVKDGAKNIDDIKLATKAVTGCTGCKVKVQKIIDHELKNMETSPVKKAVVNNVERADRVCFCNMVSRGEIIDAVQAGATDLAAIKSTTYATTACGGCTDHVVRIMEGELAKMTEVS
jgi:nitrite reductase (NADH) large subunit